MSDYIPLFYGNMITYPRPNIDVGLATLWISNPGLAKIQDIDVCSQILMNYLTKKKGETCPDVSMYRCLHIWSLDL